MSSTLSVTSEASASGVAPNAETPNLPAPLWTTAGQAFVRASRPDFRRWLRHIRPAAGCTRPVRLVGTTMTVEAGTGRLLSRVDTSTLPDGVIYKRCGNRRSAACPSCSDRYKRDAYHLIRAGLVGGKGVPESVASHPAVFVTFTAPSFGPVHTRHVRRHTCTDRRRCDCRPEPCHPRRDHPTCLHGRGLVCWARHEGTDRRLGTPLCLDCYHHGPQVVWNLMAGELWRRTGEALRKTIRRLARQRGIDPDTVKLAYGKAAEMQRRGAVHFHAIVRLDGHDPDHPEKVLPPPVGLGVGDLVDAVEHAARSTRFTTPTHPACETGWAVGWGEQLDVRVITMAGSGEVTNGLVAGYLAKYATKATEVTGHTSSRLTEQTIGLFADPDGSHTQRLVEACWTLGTPRAWRGLRRWAHMLGYGGHYLTKSRRYSITFAALREHRVRHQRAGTTGPTPAETLSETGTEAETALVVNFLQFVGAGWHTTGDALLANTSATLAREHGQVAWEAGTNQPASSAA